MNIVIPILSLWAFATLAHAAESLPKAPDPAVAKQKDRKAEAIARLRDLWEKDLSKREALKPMKEMFAQQLKTDERLSVSEITGKEAAKRVSGTLRPAEKHLIIVGDIETLKTYPKLESVHSPGEIGSGFQACFDPMGRLVFFWVIPEG